MTAVTYVLVSHIYFQGRPSQFDHTIAEQVSENCKVRNFQRAYDTVT